VGYFGFTYLSIGTGVRLLLRQASPTPRPEIFCFAKSQAFQCSVVAVRQISKTKTIYWKNNLIQWDGGVGISASLGRVSQRVSVGRKVGRKT